MTAIHTLLMPCIAFECSFCNEQKSYCNVLRAFRLFDLIEQCFQKTIKN